MAQPLSTQQIAEIRNFLDTTFSQTGIQNNAVWVPGFGVTPRAIDLFSSGRGAEWARSRGLTAQQAADLIARMQKTIYRYERGGGGADPMDAQVLQDLGVSQSIGPKINIDSGGQDVMNPRIENAIPADPRERLRSSIQAFVDELGKMPGSDNPVFSGLINAGRAAASQRIGATGVRGGFADLVSADSAQRSVLPYLQQREGMRMQGMGLLNNVDATTDQMNQGWAQLDLRRQEAEANQRERLWAQQQNQGQGLGSVIGGGLGLAGGLAATIATGGAAAPLIAPLMAGGSAIGGGLGGMSSPQFQPYSYNVNRNARRSAFSGGSSGF